MRGAAQSERQLIGKNRAGIARNCALTPLRPPGIGTVTGGSRIRSAPAMEYLYGLLFGTEPKQQSDADARHALHAKLEALPDDHDAQITLTAAELRILKEATTTTRQKHGGGDELFVRMHSNLTEDLDPSTADAVVDAYGASPLKPNPLAKRRPSLDLCGNQISGALRHRRDVIT